MEDIVEDVTFELRVGIVVVIIFYVVCAAMTGLWVKSILGPSILIALSLPALLITALLKGGPTVALVLIKRRWTVVWLGSISVSCLLGFIVFG